MSAEIFSVIAPIFVIVAIGYIIERTTKGFHTETLSRLVLLVGTPSLVFSSLTKSDLPGVEIVHIIGCAVLIVCVTGLAAFAVLSLAHLPVRTFLPPLTLPNSGNAGLPVVLFAFGEEGLAIGTAFFMVIATIQYLVVPVIMAGEFQLSDVVRQPLIVSILAVAVVAISGIEPPQIVADTTEILGGIVIPVMLILLGGAMARLPLRDIRISLLLSFGRLCLGACAAGLVIVATGITGVEAASLFILSAMPAALVTYVFAERYQRAPERVAAFVLTSTSLTFLLLPILVAIALRIAGD